MFCCLHPQGRADSADLQHRWLFSAIVIYSSTQAEPAETHYPSCHVLFCSPLENCTHIHTFWALAKHRKQNSKQHVADTPTCMLKKKTYTHSIYKGTFIIGPMYFSDFPHCHLLWILDVFLLNCIYADLVVHPGGNVNNNYIFSSELKCAQSTVLVMSGWRSKC